MTAIMSTYIDIHQKTGRAAGAPAEGARDGAAQGREAMRTARAIPVHIPDNRSTRTAIIDKVPGDGRR